MHIEYGYAPTVLTACVTNESRMSCIDWLLQGAASISSQYEIAKHYDGNEDELLKMAEACSALPVQLLPMCTGFDPRNESCVSIVKDKVGPSKCQAVGPIVVYDYDRYCCCLLHDHPPSLPITLAKYLQPPIMRFHLLVSIDRCIHSFVC